MMSVDITSAFREFDENAAPSPSARAEGARLAINTIAHLPAPGKRNMARVRASAGSSSRARNLRRITKKRKDAPIGPTALSRMMRSLSSGVLPPAIPSTVSAKPSRWRPPFVSASMRMRAPVVRDSGRSPVPASR